MVASKCFVPGCTTGYVSDRKKRRATGQKCPSLFKAPRELEIFQKWKKAIPKADRDLAEGDRICELHFLSEDIEKFHMLPLPNGDVRFIKKGKLTLKPDAVPSVFPDQPPYVNKTSIKKKSSVSVSKKTIHKEDHDLSEDEKICNLDFLDEEIGELNIFPLSHEDLLAIEKGEPTLKPDGVPSVFPDLPAYVTETSIKKKSSCKSNPLSKKAKKKDSFYHKFSFTNLVNNLDKVNKPNEWWAVSTHKNFVLCVKWNEKYSAERQIIIDANLGVRVLYYGREATNISNINVESVESVSSLLQSVDEYYICAGASRRNSSCSLYMQRKFDECGKPRRWCNDCKKNKTIGKHRKFITRRSQYQKLYHQITSVES